MSTEAMAEAKDAYSACQRGVDSLFGAARQAAPRYHQSVADAQQAFLDAFEGAIGSSLALQRDVAAGAGMAASMPEASLRAAREAADGAARAAAAFNQVALAAIDAARQGAKAFGDGARAAADLQRDLARSWLSSVSAGRG